MFCAKCGKENEDGNQFCKYCGNCMTEQPYKIPPVNSSEYEIYEMIKTQKTEALKKKCGASFGNLVLGVVSRRHNSNHYSVKAPRILIFYKLVLQTRHTAFNNTYLDFCRDDHLGIR